MCKKLLIKHVIEFILIIMKKIREKNKSVASGLSVIDFEHLWSSRSDEHVNSAWYCLEYSTKQIKHQ